MSSRAAEFASAILIGVLVGVFAGAYLITMPYGAADDCLTEPRGATLQGQHWFYRIERGTKRHCWYLKDEGEKVARAATAEPAAPAKTTSQNTDSPAVRRSIADARAEWRSRAGIENDTSAVQPARSAVAAATNPAGANGNGANIVSPWSALTGVSSSAAQPSTPQPSESQPSESQAMVVADNTQPSPALARPATTPTMAAPTMTAPMATAPMSAAADDAAASAASGTPTEKYTGSLQELMVVAFAALALAGLTGSAVYRLGRLRFARRYNASRRSADWQPPRKKSRSARAANPRPAPTRAESVHFAPKSKDAPRPDFTPQPKFAPQPKIAVQPEDAPQPEYASRPATRPNYEPQHNVAVLSEYAPKPRGGVRMTRELEETFESIEELLIRLAK